MDNTNNVVYQRLIEAINLLRGTGLAVRNSEIETKTGFSKSVISTYLSGARPPSENFIRTFCGAYNLNSDYILYGSGLLEKSAAAKSPSASDAIRAALSRLDQLEADVKLLKLALLNQHESSK